MLPFVNLWVSAGGTVSKKSAVERRKIHVDLPAELHHKLRIKAALDGVSSQAFMAQLVAEAVGGIALPSTRKQPTRSR